MEHPVIPAQGYQSSSKGYGTGRKRWGGRQVEDSSEKGKGGLFCGAKFEEIVRYLCEALPVIMADLSYHKSEINPRFGIFALLIACTTTAGDFRGHHQQLGWNL